MYETLEEKLAQEVELLTNNPAIIPDHWEAATPLFDFIPKVGYCLTQICTYHRSATENAWRSGDPVLIEFVDRVLADDRIPDHFRDISVENLPVFAQYQLEAQKFKD